MFPKFVSWAIESQFQVAVNDNITVLPSIERRSVFHLTKSRRTRSTTEWWTWISMYHTPLQENFYLSTTNSFPQGRLIFYFVVQAWDGHYFTWRVQKIMLIIKDNAFKTNYKKYHRILLFVLPSFWCPVTIPCHTDVSVYKSMLFHENVQNFMWHYLRLGRQHFLHDG